MKSETLVETVLIVVLAVYGVHLARELRGLTSETARRRSFVSSASDNLALQSVNGIDVFGQLVNKVVPVGAKRFVIFGFRNSTLQDDVRFWSDAARLLPADGSVRLLAYCDGTPCVDTVKHSYQSLGFPVVAYGEPGSLQAVSAADTKGNCIVLSAGLMTVGKVLWRQPNTNPSDVVRLVSQ
jgi:hypothetical protein